MSRTCAEAGFRRPLILHDRALGAVRLGQVPTRARVRMVQAGASWRWVAYAVDSGRGLACGLFMAVSTLPAVSLAPVVTRVVARSARRSVLRSAAVVADTAGAPGLPDGGDRESTAPPSAPGTGTDGDAGMDDGQPHADHRDRTAGGSA